MSDETVRRRLLIRGRVQGVFYRDFTRTAATRERVSGWAANRDDGSVEVVLEGPVDNVEAVVRRCGDGPSGARVESVQVADEPPEGLDGFEIR